MHKDNFKTVSRLRLDESKILLKQQQWSGAYYLAGYAVECGLKSCIAKQFLANEFPDKKFVNNVFTHDLQSLVNLAGLKTSLDHAMNANSMLELNWSLTKDWNEQSRYRIWTEQQANDLLDAISHRTNGVMKWVRSQW